MNKADGGNMRSISTIINPYPQYKGLYTLRYTNMVSWNITMFHRKYTSSNFAS